jgi:transmembrane sensor
MPPELQEEVERGSPDTRRKLEQVWHLLGRLEDEPLDVPGTEAAWADVQRRLDAPPTRPAERAPERGRLRRSPRWIRAALTTTTGLAVLLVGVWLWGQPVAVVVPRGDQRLVTLPDGSTAQLNSDSRLQYRRGFQAWPFVEAAERVVILQGEAYFDVARAAQPFVVETFNARVEVLGTTFNVRARQGRWEDETAVTLASGRVRVRARQHPEDEVTLAEAGQVARIRPASARLDASLALPDHLHRLLAWRQQGFSFIDKPLAFILAEIERRFDLSIDAEAGIALTDSMNLFYTRDVTAEQILRDICLAQDCRYRATSGGYLVFPADP